MVAVARNICTAKKHTSGAKNIYYLLSLIHYLLSKVPGCENGFVRPLRFGLLFQAELVGASLEAPVVSLCADRKINAKHRDFVGFLRGCIGQGSRAATSAARTNLDVRC